MPGLIVIVIWAVFAIGWVWNVVDFVNLDFEAPYKAEIIRGAGVVVAPVGGVLGYIRIED